ncbi:MAG: S8 family serine peptidase [Acidobacteriota bacterium]|nr:S8 family serine peptidase [Acidobacteriota bacterium]
MKLTASVVALLAVLALPASALAQQTYVISARAWGPAQAAAVAEAGGTVVFGHDGAGVGVATSSAPDFAARLRASDAITSVEADQVIQWQLPTATVELDEAFTNPPNDDTFFNGIQWAPQAIDAPAAWASGCTGNGVRVAILDGGIHSTHVDLVANLDVAASRSFVSGTNFNQDTGTFWHGTHVAGIVAAADNGIGTVGIAPQARLIGVKVLHNGRGGFGGVIQGIVYAATPLAVGGGGADIINMSLGAVFPKNEPGAGQLVAAMNKAVNYANRFGVLVVSAAGNNGLDLDHSGNIITVPAESGAGVAVSATAPIGWATGATDFDRPTSYTNYGTSVINVSAPGGDSALPGNEFCTRPTTTGSITRPCWVFDLVFSTVRGTSNGAYGWAAGTSMAAPAASAVAAIIKQKNPNISLGALKTALQNSAIDAGKNGADPFHGKGWVNALRACQY